MARHISVRGIQKNAFIGITLAALMLMKYAIAEFNFDFDAVTRTLREYVCLMLMLILLDERFSINEKLRQSISKLVLLFAKVLPIILLIQIIGIASGHLLFMPEDWLVANANTLPNELTLDFDAGMIRPSATWGEPSYLGFFSLSMLVIALNSFKPGRNLKVVIGLLLLSLILSRTLSGLLSFVIVLAIHYRHQLRGDAIKRLLIFCLGISLPALALYLFTVPIESMPWWLARLGSVIAGNDASGNIRMFAPFDIITYVFSHHPFGIPLDRLPSWFSSVDQAGTDNGLLNLFSEFGYAGFIIFFVLIKKFARVPLLLPYILLSSMFNGAFLAVDKASIIAMIIILMSANSEKDRGEQLAEYPIKRGDVFRNNFRNKPINRFRHDNV